MMREFAEAAKGKCETLGTEADIFEVWTSFVVSGERLVAFRRRRSSPKGIARCARPARDDFSRSYAGDTCRKQTSGKHQDRVKAPAVRAMNPEWMLGCLYVTAYGLWAWTFRTRVDSWMRRQLGRRLSAKVVWIQASAFPIELWVWGLRRTAVDAPVAEQANRLALTSVAAGLAGAILPTALLCAFEAWSMGLPEAVNGALYLSTPLLITLFAVGYLRWRGPPGQPAVATRLDTKHDS